MRTWFRFSVYVQPRASKTAIAGKHDGLIKVRVAAPPVDGAANRALIEFVAERLKISNSRVRLVGGETARRKVLEVEGLCEEEVFSLLQ
jgi:uncharacterized protein